MKSRPVFQRKDEDFKYCHLPHNYVWKIKGEEMFVSVNQQTWDLYKGPRYTHNQMIQNGWQAISRYNLIKLYPKLSL